MSNEQLPLDTKLTALFASIETIQVMMECDLFSFSGFEKADDMAKRACMQLMVLIQGIEEENEHSSVLSELMHKFKLHALRHMSLKNPSTNLN